MDYLILALGLIVLIFSGELLVRSAVGLALKLNVSPMVVGLTVVSFGTSAPELLVSLQAAMEGRSAIAMGNVVGSNIANLGLVLGLTAMVMPLAIVRKTIRFDWPVLFGISLLLVGLVWFDLRVDWYDGVALLVLIVTYLVFLFKTSQADEVVGEVSELEGESNKSFYWLLAILALGCIGLVFGSDWFLGGATSIAEDMGVSDHVIGVTLVAFGTSVPELVTSLVAAFRKQTDISIGNLIGSNIFNICVVLGITSLVHPVELAESVVTSDLMWMLGFTFIILPFMLTGKKISRWEGVILAAGYVSYVVFVLR
ncbi:MAG: cation:H+ antiporter [Luteibaculaceae bacterium]|jgi:cation:H+ antiporter